MKRIIFLSILAVFSVSAFSACSWFEEPPVSDDESVDIMLEINDEATHDARRDGEVSENQIPVAVFIGDPSKKLTTSAVDVGLAIE